MKRTLDPNDPLNDIEEIKERADYRMYLPSLFIASFLTVITFKDKIDRFSIGVLAYLSLVTLIYSFIVLFFISLMKYAGAESLYDWLHDKSKTYVAIIVVIVLAVALTAFFMWRLL